MKLTKILILVAVLAPWAPRLALGCTMQKPTVTTPPVWSNPFIPGILPTPVPGIFQTVVSLDVDLFPPIAPTTCACGLGLAPPGVTGLPPSVDVTQAFLTRRDLLTNQHTVLAEFAPLGHPGPSSSRPRPGSGRR